MSCRASILSVVTALPFVLCGCGKSDLPRTDVSGTVTLDGDPVPYGLLMLKGEPNEHQNVTQVYLIVQAGAFSSRDQNVPGPSPGKNEAVITIYKGEAPMGDEDGTPKVQGLHTTSVQIDPGQPLQIALTRSDLKESKAD